MPIDLAGATVVLTGASSGIGEAAAVALARQGARLALVARREDRLEAVAEACRAAGSPEVLVRPADLSDLDLAESVARDLDEHFGGVDVLVNNAAAPKRKGVTELRVDEVESTMALNYLSPVRMTLAVLPGMLARRRGCIVNVSSLGGRLGIRGEAAYSASKFALCGFSESMLADLAGTGVDVRLILPGAIATEIWDQPDNDMPFYDGPLEPPDTVADAIVQAIQGDQVEWYVPDLKPVVEMKTADLQGFVASMLVATDEMASSHDEPADREASS